MPCTTIFNSAVCAKARSASSSLSMSCSLSERLLCENSNHKGGELGALTPDPWGRNRDDDRTPIGPGDV